MESMKFLPVRLLIEEKRNRLTKMSIVRDQFETGFLPTDAYDVLLDQLCKEADVLQEAIDKLLAPEERDQVTLHAI